ncbi:MAG: hypothetical protein K2L31_07545 [Muribaculum sp.]|nr:hypothetical protein [Muribaculum sp.]
MIARIISLILLLSVCAFAQAKEKSDKMKPKWMTSSLPAPKSPGYIFISAQGTGSSLEEARQSAFVNLTTKLEHERGLVINSSVKVDKEASRISGSRSSVTRQQFQMECTERGKEITLTCRAIDEYWEQNHGRYTVTELYTVNDNKIPDTGSYNDNIRLTTSYGAAPVFYSLIPGVGQFSKGSYVKGGLMLGGTAIGAAAIILCENQRADCAKKMREKPQHFDFYRNKKSNWETGRNVAIGATAALYIYNLIDAAVAPGRRRVVVKNRSYNYSLSPVMYENGAGIGLAFNF